MRGRGCRSPASEPRQVSEERAGFTPNGLPREYAWRPDNAPIVVVPNAAGTLAFVTLRGGGLFVIDPSATPMKIVAEYDRTTVHASADHPTPDLADISPAGNRIFVSLRGPNPLSGSPHAATGSTPGLGVIQLAQGGEVGELKNVVPLSNIDASGIERA